ncbi:hypothetical protein M5D96_004934, partial [Drosophila gunungcola]
RFSRTDLNFGLLCPGKLSASLKTLSKYISAFETKSKPATICVPNCEQKRQPPRSQKGRNCLCILCSECNKFN